MADESSRELLTRVSADRADAHRRYNEALTTLDRAIQALPDWPAPPPPYDATKIPALNESWTLLPQGVPVRSGGLRGRWSALVWQIVGPIFQQQMAFNAALVDHLNRNAHAHHEAHEAIARAMPALRAGFEGLVRFESLLVQFLQKITPLLDTRERAIAEAVDELRHVAEVAQRAAVMARREMDRTGHAVAAPQATGPEPQAPGPKPQASLSRSQASGDAFKYVGFEDRFRGSESDIRARLMDYVPYFRGSSNVLDVGCGRGEFLDLLKANGVSACGLDLNPEMVEVCRARGLDASAGDALAYLTGVPDESLGGLLAIQVVEHLEPEYLSRFLQTAFYKLRPGARMVLETINPACWVAFFESYIRDLTHVRPIHPDTLQYLLHASGFGQVEIVYRSPIGEEARLQRVTPRPEHFGEGAVDPLTELVSAFNHNMDRLNARMFTYQDFAAVARRP